jgi:glycosyltransferase involved in cell wall biosynthesis
LEAGAVGIPCLGSRIYGISDSVVDGTTGLLHEPANVSEIVVKLANLIDDPSTRRRLGKAARARVHRDFDSKKVVAALVALYARLIVGKKQ